MSDMTIIEEAGIVEASDGAYLNFGGIIAGAIAAAAVGTVLNGFGIALGLALGSTSPT